MSVHKFILFVLAVSKENLVIRTCIDKDMNSQCGIFMFRGEKIRGCMLTCQKDLCNAAPQLFRGSKIIAFILVFLNRITNI